MVKNKSFWLFFLVFLASVCKVSSQVREDIDARVVLTQSQGSTFGGSAMLVSNQGIRRPNSQSTAGQFRLTNGYFGDANGLCEDEPLADTRFSSGAFCSGTLIAPNVILTAAHCVAGSGGCRQFSIVMGVTSENINSSLAVRDHLYTCTDIVYGPGWNPETLGPESGSPNFQDDWAIVTLNRPVVGIEPVAVQPRAVQVGEPVSSVGNPSGLPLVQSRGRVTHRLADLSGVGTNLTLFGGNSGGGVFNKRNELVGVAVSSWGIQNGPFYAEPSGCLRWARQNPIREPEYFQDSGTAWVTGGGIVPASNIYGQLAPFLAPPAATDVNPNPSIEIKALPSESRGVQ